ncbi:glycosyl hydrolase [Enterococcus saigonensis]|uniref:Glycosyl hydrolase n=1 Tax=Enterococcus saigonensis TaxID=1805431 RepID=A0A679I7Z8_9ENTE|nr:beta-galactosidase family protein [Enterococcus saigonensis]BCA84560.1 glycosyl hydrolase [Enterococcus saigonensis]
MNSIEIKQDFIINEKKTKIISGAVHYFRIVEEYWGYALDCLKEVGCNTVETYIPWNYHEMYEGDFDFESYGHDLIKFIKEAEKRNLFVILRPSPYICAEWEFGGLPFWLLEKNCKIRSSDPLFIEYVERYFDILLPKLKEYQWTENGPVIMMQLENEYGSYGNDKEYLSEILRIMKKYIDVPIFTSDGSWKEALTAGSLLEKSVFPTGNFGSNAIKNVKNLVEFMEENKIEAPIMCMEFWDGWFNRWDEEIIRRDPQELKSAVEEMYNLGSLNLYMFQGGTNFGFMNGCSARGTNDLHQITSYDYDAVLTEWGDKTEKFHLLQSLFSNEVKSEVTKSHTKKAFKRVKYIGAASLFENLETVSRVSKNKWPLSMEKLGQGYGYIAYKSNIGPKRHLEKVRVIEASDRAKIYVNNKEIATQYKKEIGTELSVDLSREEDNELIILMENMGRVNYGSKLLAPTQRKGIRGGVMLDLHFHSEWTHYCIDVEKSTQLNYENFTGIGPSFYKFELFVDEPADTFVDCRGWGKGCLLVNGFNLGRFWEVGPTGYLYLPAPLLKAGVNEIIVFETEGKFNNELKFSKEPIYIEIGEKR